MKKFTSLLMAALLMLAVLVPVQGFAQEDQGLEKAIKTARSLLNITDTYDDFNYSISNQEGKTVYYLWWNDTKNKLGNVNVTIDSDGKISSYYCYKPDEGRNVSKIPAVSKADALKIANEFIKKVNPSIWSNIRYEESNAPISIYNMNYDFNYVRVENGIPFHQDNVRVSVDSREGFVQNYSLNWTDGLTFPSSSGVMSMAKAQQVFAEKLGLKLAYKLRYDEDAQTPYLVYTNVYSGRSIDAITGEVVNYNIYYGIMEKGEGMDIARDRAAEAPAAPQIILTPEEKKAVESASNFLSQAKAEETGRKVLSLDSSYKLESINLYSSGTGKGNYSWTMYFSKEEKRNDSILYYHASISIDAANGEVLNFYRYMPGDADAPVKYNKEQAKKIAEDIIRSMQPSKFGEVEYTDWGEPEFRPLDETEKPRQYNFNFVRKAGSAYFLNNGFNITVDTTNGMVTNYSYSWYKDELPSADNVITSAKAHEILFDSIGLELQYIADYTNSVGAKIIMPPTRDTVTPQIKLVYALNQKKPSNIDAVSGNLLDYSGKPYVEPVIAEYSDISGSPAESQIKILAQFGISLPGTTFKPGQNITQRDFLYLLAKAKDPYINFRPTGDSKDDEDLYNYLINAGIVKEGEKSPTSAVTKQDGAKFIVRALGYNKIADIKGIYKLPFKDASSIKSDLYGYVAIAYGLNIVKDSKGYFRPGSYMTRGDSAIAIYNLLNIN